MSNELYRKYRPRKLSELVGQESAARMIFRMLKTGKIPHVFLFTGPTGVGKTTLSRILRRKLKCSTHDFYEYNTADFRGVDMVREIRSTLPLAPMGGPCKIYYMDECHRLTSDAQSAMLKMLEDTPDHVYFILSTNEPSRLLPTVRGRCTEVKLVRLSEGELAMVVESVLKKEKKEIGLDVAARLCEVADGSARKALVLLGQIIDLSPKHQMKVLDRSDVRTQAIELARMLISPRPSWPDVVKILNNLEDDPESLRRMVLGYAAAVLKKNGKLAKRACFLIDVFGTNFYDSGPAGLTAACYAVCYQ